MEFVLPHRLFTCRRCGFCCQGETTVSLNDEDCRRMAAILGVSLEELFARYLRRSGSCVQMRTVDGHCIFYDHGCLVHRARPRLCAQWPLHPAILKDESNYGAIGASCPGLETSLSYPEFSRALADLLTDGDIAC